MKTIPKALANILLDLCCVLGLADLGAAPAAAQPGRAGDVRAVVVNVERLLVESPQARAAAARIEAEFAPRRQQVAAQLRQLRDRSEQLTRDAPGLSEREQLLRSRELGELERAVRRAQAQIGEILPNARRPNAPHLPAASTRSCRPCPPGWASTWC
ncbi:hypothetical protein G4G28_03890 [Massilia sp. Dwa41.01b]|uniref:OmpH family outer membrane protein n=1 Tax=Massilia sp. Dwa41.01b TaxID=2709302 RepID=UPI001603A6D0|nr:OmpH family outer membrane protein [Massilia sp. Dwa41.01b]QNA87818.1 hypothetical protein G4G28_03890 [Massilia sp. Dwa41.01b]